jgi:hypothetical protein
MTQNTQGKFAQLNEESFKLFAGAVDGFRNQLKLIDGEMPVLDFNDFKWMSESKNTYIKSQCMPYWFMLLSYCRAQLLHAHLTCIVNTSNKSNLPGFMLDSNNQKIIIINLDDAFHPDVLYDLPKTRYSKFRELLVQYIEIPEKVYLPQ